MTTLLYIEHDDGALKDASRRALTAALQLGAPVHALVVGEHCKNVADQAAKLEGIDKVILVDDPAQKHHLAEPLATLVVSIVGNYDAIVAASTAEGKNMLPRVAALLDVMQVSDVIRVIDYRTFDRPIYAGNAIQTVQTTDAKTVLTVRTSAFQPTNDRTFAAPIEIAFSTPDCSISIYKDEAVSRSDGPELSSAKIVVSGGRALGSADHFRQVIVPLADQLGAATGASRAAVDAGYAPNDLQVGQTGKVIAPDLYVAIGISGAIQHLAGMKDSKLIVAINNDEDAPIFSVADFGLVADLFSAVPELLVALNKITK